MCEPASALASAEWPVHLLEAVDSCPACDSGRCALLYSELTDVVFGCAPGRWRMYRCSDCGSLYLNPRPSPAGIRLAYTSYYTHVALSEAAATGGLRGLRLAVRNGYVNSRLGTRLAPASRAGRWLVPLARQFASPGLRILVDHLSVPDAGGRFFDVGAGSGAWLATAAALGWWVCGVENDRAAAAMGACRRSDAICAALPRLPIATGAADTVLLSHVFEHLHDPRACLRELGRVLRGGGTLLMAMPNADALLHRRYGRHWLGLDAPRHLVIFTRGALGRLLADSGFEPRAWLRPALRDVSNERTSRNLARGRSPYGPCRLGPAVGGAALRAFRAWSSPSVADELIVAAVKR